MSTIICCVDSDGLALASDSRFMDSDLVTVLSDSVQKIIPLREDLFICCTGWSQLIHFQETKARELAATITDIRDLSAALDEASRGPLKQLAADLEAMGHSNALPLHGAMLAGRNGDLFGYSFTKYWLRDGRIVPEIAEHFGGPGTQFVECSFQFTGPALRAVTLWQNIHGNATRVAALPEARETVQ